MGILLWQEPKGAGRGEKSETIEWNRIRGGTYTNARRSLDFFLGGAESHGSFKQGRSKIKHITLAITLSARLEIGLDGRWEDHWETAMILQTRGDGGADEKKGVLSK